MSSRANPFCPCRTIFFHHGFKVYKYFFFSLFFSLSHFFFFLFFLKGVSLVVIKEQEY